MFEIASNMATVNQFRDVYGMRFVGLEDQSNSVYYAYRVPDPEAPYPQDYVIDQNGVVRYWSWEYDPQSVIRVIDDLLGQSGVEDPGDSPEIAGLHLAAPSPNPFGPGTRLSFLLRERANVNLSVYSVSGRQVRTLFEGEKGAGEHVVSWDGRDESGRRLASGVYFVELRAGDDRQVRRAVLLK